MSSIYNKLDSISYSDIQSFFSFHNISYIGLVLLKYTAYAVIFLIIAWLLVVAVLKLIDLISQLRPKYIFLEVTPPLTTEVSSFSNTQLFGIIIDLLNQRIWYEKLILKRSSLSFELVSDKKNGIRYVLRTPCDLKESVEKTLRSYMPGLEIREAEDFTQEDPSSISISEYKLAKHYLYPLNDQFDPKKHDPLSYIAGNMTQLKDGEMMAMQVIIRPLSAMKRISIKRAKFLLGRENYSYFESPAQKVAMYFVIVIESLVRIVMIPLLFISEFAGGNAGDPLPRAQNKTKKSNSEKEYESPALPNSFFQNLIRFSSLNPLIACFLKVVSLSRS